MSDINVGAISEALNDKADRDINNLTTGGYAKCSGLGMPSGRYISLTLGASGTTYTAPANGWYFVNKTAGSSNYYVSINLINDNGSTIITNFMGTYQTSPCTCIMPVKKGNKVKIDYNATGTTNVFRFIYAEGEQN